MIVEMLERVARALLDARLRPECASFAQVLAGLDPDNVHLQADLASMLARAAIEAMRDCTTEMYDAGQEFVGMQGDAGDAEKVWTAMLSAALQPLPDVKEGEL